MRALYIFCGTQQSADEAGGRDFHFFDSQAAVSPQKKLPNHHIYEASLVIKNKLLHILLWEDN